MRDRWALDVALAMLFTATHGDERQGLELALRHLCPHELPVLKQFKLGGGGHQLLFMHVPKTGGFGYTDLFNHIWNGTEETVCFIVPHEDFLDVRRAGGARKKSDVLSSDAMTPELLGQCSFTSAHWLDSSAERLFPAPERLLKMMTLRDPVRRLVSWAEYSLLKRYTGALRGCNGTNFCAVDCGELHAYLENEQLIADNVLTHTAAGTFAYLDALGEYCSAPHRYFESWGVPHRPREFCRADGTIDMPMYESLLPPSLAAELVASPSKLLEAAKRNLCGFAFVGTTAHYDEQIELFIHTFGLDEGRVMDFLNSERHVISTNRIAGNLGYPARYLPCQDALMAARQRQRLDVELVEFANELVKTRLGLLHALRDEQDGLPAQV